MLIIHGLFKLFVSRKNKRLQINIRNFEQKLERMHQITTHYRIKRNKFRQVYADLKSQSEQESSRVTELGLIACL